MSRDEGRVANRKWQGANGKGEGKKKRVDGKMESAEERVSKKKRKAFIAFPSVLDTRHSSLIYSLCSGGFDTPFRPCSSRLAPFLDFVKIDRWFSGHGHNRESMLFNLFLHRF